MRTLVNYCGEASLAVSRLTIWLPLGLFGSFYAV